MDQRVPWRAVADQFQYKINRLSPLPDRTAWRTAQGRLALDTELLEQVVPEILNTAVVDVHGSRDLVVGGFIGGTDQP